MSRSRRQFWSFSLALALLMVFVLAAGGCRPSASTDASNSVNPTQPEGRPWSTEFTPEILAQALRGLPINDFFDLSWKLLLLRDPESVVACGLARSCGLDEPVLTDISDAYVRDTYRMYATVLEMLRQYDRGTLDPQQQVSYDVYEWYLDDRTRQREFIYYDYPVTYFSNTAVQEQTMYFFAELHPVATLKDAEDYVARLGQVGAKFEQLLEGLRLREEAGIVPPGFVVQWTLPGVEKLASAQATATPYYQALQRKLGALRGVGSGPKQDLLQAAEEAIGNSVLPAYQSLADYLRRPRAVAFTGDGVGQFPKGDVYYAYLLRHYTTTEITANEVHQLGLRELERIHAEMRVVFDQLGYPKVESLPALFDRVARDGESVPANRVIQTYKGLIDEAEGKLDQAFAKRPRAEVVVAQGPLSGAYQPPALDGSRPGTFWAGPADRPEELFAMRTLTYHETVPGHHVQLAYPISADLPFFLSLLTFDGYCEGWALYAERLAWELGWYEGDPYGNLGRLQAEAFRAARLVVDTGIHVEGWTFERAETFFSAETGYGSGDLIDPNLQISRYVVWPGQATAYYIGMLKFLELRQEAKDRLGSRFDLKEFHDVVLSNGSMPLEVLERVVDDYVQAKDGS